MKNLFRTVQQTILDFFLNSEFDALVKMIYLIINLLVIKRDNLVCMKTFAGNLFVYSAKNILIILYHTLCIL